jgi:hypothetical protein
MTTVSCASARGWKPDSPMMYRRDSGAESRDTARFSQKALISSVPHRTRSSPIGPHRVAFNPRSGGQCVVGCLLQRFFQIGSRSHRCSVRQTPLHDCADFADLAGSVTHILCDRFVFSVHAVRLFHSNRRKSPIASYKVFHFEVSSWAPRLDLGSESQQILILAPARSIWDFQPLGTKTRVMPFVFLTH